MHPCLSCGACCASFRVSFHWSETEPMLGGAVPAALTERVDAHRVAMRGSWAKQPRCVALDAEIGVRSRCTIHPQRPSVCREVAASWEFGVASAQCDRARIAHGLRPLTPQDWAPAREPAEAA
ncbi:MAG TPA: YkgJ family cysteine cluster protein [Lysobacter sp.]|nr:YkgJ family cysteine cluster protein [Lysobacter sp.]